MKTVKCREQSCQAELVFLRTKKGSLMPVDAESLSDEDIEMLERKEEVQYRHGEHKSHFQTCTKPNQF